MGTVLPKTLAWVINDLDARTDRVLSELHPQLRAKAQQLLEMFDGALGLYEGFRDKAAQESRKAQGTSNAGWLESPHNYRPALATDAVLHPRIVPVSGVLNHANGKWYPNLWDYETPEARKIWDELHLAAHKLGLGRVFIGKGVKRRLDHPHLELPNWKQLR